MKKKKKPAKKTRLYRKKLIHYNFKKYIYLQPAMAFLFVEPRNKKFNFILQFVINC